MFRSQLESIFLTEYFQRFLIHIILGLNYMKSGISLRMLISSITLSFLLLIGEKHAVLVMKFSFLLSRFLFFTFFFLIVFLGRVLYLIFKAEAFSLSSRFILLLNLLCICLPLMLNADIDGEILLKF